MEKPITTKDFINECNNGRGFFFAGTKEESPERLMKMP